MCIRDRFHDRPFHFATVNAMQKYTALMDGDLAITHGWDNYDDGHGAYWNIRVKHKDETPDEENVISINTDMGLVAERNSSLLSADSLEDFLYGYTIEIKPVSYTHLASPDAVNNAVLDQLYETLTQRNDELIDKLNKADQPAKLSNKQQLFIQLLQQGKEDNP